VKNQSPEAKVIALLERLYKIDDAVWAGMSPTLRHALAEEMQRLAALGKAELERRRGLGGGK
jgi:hypothetical protein